MRLTKVQRLVLYALGEFYASLNQQLLEKNLRLRTSKITFIELLLSSQMIIKQERAVYKNLESLEQQKFIAYENKMIRFTEKGAQEFHKINEEIRQFLNIRKYLKETKSSRTLQTVMSE